MNSHRIFCVAVVLFCVVPNALAENEATTVPVLASSLAFSPDGLTLALGGPDGVLHVWDLGEAKESRSFKSKDSIECLAWSPDGKQLAYVAGEAVILIDATTGAEARRWRGGSEVAFSPSGRVLAFGSRGASGTIHLWDFASAKERQLKGHINPITGLAFSSDGRLLGSVGNDNTARLWNVETGASLHTFRGPAGALFMSGVAFSTDSGTLAYGTNVPEDKGGGWMSIKGSRIVMRDTTTGAESGAVDAHGQALNGLAYLQGGKGFVSAARDSLKVWEGTAAAANKEMPIECLKFALSPSGELVACADRKAVTLVRLAAD